jgi:hypothetical protein
MSACGTEQQSFGFSFMPAIGGAADLSSHDQTSGVGANGPNRSCSKLKSRSAAVYSGIEAVAGVLVKAGSANEVTGSQNIGRRFPVIR